jgi:ABC-type bacteriocin/lantibiotic exporter with double-glycine peptidase domain
MKRGYRACIRQRDSSDCGPACLASVMAYHGFRETVSQLRLTSGTDHLGTSMLGMIRALKTAGFEAKGLQGSPDHLEKLPLPFIAHTILQEGMHHYICVYGINGRRVRVMDPSSGKLTSWKWELFRKQWSGSVIALVPGSPSPVKEKATSHRKRILQLLSPLRGPVIQALISAMLYTLLGLSGSIYLGKLTDHVFVTHNRGLLNLMSLTMVVITLLMIYFSVLKRVIMLKTGQVIDNQLIASYYRHLLGLPQRFFDSMKTGEIISRINDAVKIRAFINEAAVGIVVNLLILLFSFGFMFAIHPPLALVMSGIIPLFALIYYLFNRQNTRTERRVMERAATMEEQLVESLQSSTYLKQYNLGNLAREKTEWSLNRLLDSLYRSGINAISASGGIETLNRLFTIILLWAGSCLVMDGSITPGKLLTFYALTGYFTGPVSGLIGANRAWQNARIAADRLFEIFDLESEETRGKPSIKREQFGDIVLSGVSFSHGTRDKLFEGLELTIPAGKVTAITGPSGSGKSTVASLVQHLYPVQKGHITVNGCDTRHFNLESIRALMGVVPQQVTFLNGSILENVAPGVAEPDISRVTRLIKSVGLITMITSLPGGFHHRLTSNGSNLSGGERQRLALARALYRDPMLLILDEATASLDPLSELYVNRLLLGLKELSQTMLLITHKKQYTALADLVYELDQGKVRLHPCPRQEPCPVP